MAEPIKLLGPAERKIIAKELLRLRQILAAIEQLENCGEDCTDSSVVVKALWTKYTNLLKEIYQESPDQPPWQAPTGRELSSAKS